jgi:hypothetical protein
MEPIDSLTSILPFVIVLGFECIAIFTGIRSDPEDSDGGSTGRSLIDVADQVEQSFLGFDFKGQVLLEPGPLEEELTADLESYFEEDSEELEDCRSAIVKSVQYDVPLDESALATIARQYTQFAYDRSRLIISSLATIVSLLVVVFNRSNVGSLPILRTLTWMILPIILLLLLSSLIGCRYIDSPFDYASVAGVLSFSPVSGLLAASNFVIIFQIFILDIFIIGY